MKIVFLTSGLEPAFDGVGDYTRLLAAECERQGHSVRLISLHDPHIEKSDRSDLNCLRLSSKISWSDRVNAARDFIDEFSPDFVSLQFVCYGFQSRGIAWKLPSVLKSIIGQRPVQIMFHELWIGGERNARLKHRFLGMLQCHLILKIVNQLKIRAVHTSNPAYLALLEAHQIKAFSLPLFGNLPLHEHIGGQASSLSRPAGFQPAATFNEAYQSRNEWSFGFFGTLHPIWPPEPLFSYLRETGKKITISHIGRLGAGTALWEKLKRDYHGHFEFQTVGEQSPEFIAEFLATQDFGIATSPWELIGKSGTVAAMLEQGLPVIVNRDDVHYNGWTETGYSRLLIKMGTDFPIRLTEAHRSKSHRILPDVARQFLQDLATK